jgi:hypothetical protein
MYAFLAAALLTQSEPADPCAYDRAAMMALDQRRSTRTGLAAGAGSRAIRAATRPPPI